MSNATAYLVRSPVRCLAMALAAAVVLTAACGGGSPAPQTPAIATPVAAVPTASGQAPATGGQQLAPGRNDAGAEWTFRTTGKVETARKIQVRSDGFTPARDGHMWVILELEVRSPNRQSEIDLWHNFRLTDEQERKTFAVISGSSLDVPNRQRYNIFSTRQWIVEKGQTTRCVLVFQVPLNTTIVGTSTTFAGAGRFVERMPQPVDLIKFV